MKQKKLTQLLKLLPRLALLVLVFGFAPSAFAKKDLFGQPSSSEKSADESTQKKSESSRSSFDNQTLAPLTTELPPPPEPEPTIIELREQEALQKSKEAPSQSLWGSTKNGIIYLRDEIVDLKDNLIGKPKPRKAPITTSVPQDFQTAAPEYTAYETKLSPTDAVKRALKIADGQVINLRMFQEGEKTVYSVKLLQKDGRMRSVILDANTGEQLEDTNEPIEE